MRQATFAERKSMLRAFSPWCGESVRLIVSHFSGFPLWLCSPAHQEEGSTPHPPFWLACSRFGSQTVVESGAVSVLSTGLKKPSTPLLSQNSVCTMGTNPRLPAADDRDSPVKFTAPADSQTCEGGHSRPVCSSLSS